MVMTHKNLSPSGYWAQSLLLGILGFGGSLSGCGTTVPLSSSPSADQVVASNRARQIFLTECPNIRSTLNDILGTERHSSLKRADIFQNGVDWKHHFEKTTDNFLMRVERRWIGYQVDGMVSKAESLLTRKPWEAFDTLEVWLISLLVAFASVVGVIPFFETLPESRRDSRKSEQLHNIAIGAILMALVMFYMIKTIDAIAYTPLLNEDVCKQISDDSL